MSPRTQLVSLLIALLAAGIGIGVVLFDDDGDGRTDRITIDVRVPGVAPVQVDRDNEQQPDEREEARIGTAAGPPGPVAPHAPATPDVHEDTRDETPGKRGVENGPPAAKRTPGGVGPPVELGGAQVHSCPRRFVRNHSARNGRVSMFVLHFTVSAPGSLDAIRRLFDTPSFGASSTFGMELSTRCEQWVPVDRKPWTQGAFNSASESVEIVTFDRTRQQWLTSPMIQRGHLASLVADRLKARGLPPRLVDPVGCTPIAGLTDHNRLECANDHTDVGRNFPWDVFMQQVRRAYYGGNPVRPTPVVSPKALAYCKQLNRYRRIRASGKRLEPGQAARAARLKRALERRYDCGRRGATTVIRRR